jgi:hypothetical protein
MAESFKHRHYSLTTANTTLYTCPSLTSGIVFMAQVANKSNVDSTTVTVTSTKSSDGSTKFLIKDVVIPSAVAASVLTGKLVLEAGDSISANAASNNMIDVTFSILEIT